MKYKNVSDKVKTFKIKNNFIVVKPGKMIDLPMRVHEPGLELCKGKSKVPKKGDLAKEELENLTKDKLNDYAALIGCPKVNTRDRKSKMIADILKYQKK